jgi:hypothetical protein
MPKKTKKERSRSKNKNQPSQQKSITPSKNNKKLQKTKIETSKELKSDSQIENPKELNEESTNKYLNPAELLFYLSFTFEHDDYYKYIKWLSDKINNQYTIKECLIHNENHDSVFSNFTTKLLSNKNMVSDYHEYKQSFMYDELFKSVKIYNSYLTKSKLLNTMLVYQHDKLIYREIYQKEKIINNIIDYEYHINNIEKYTEMVKLINNLNEIYSPLIRHKPFTIINRKYVKFNSALINKINNTLNNEKIMNEVYDIIKNIKLKYKFR